MANKKKTSYSLSQGALDDLATLAEIHIRSNANMIEVLIENAKKDLERLGKWPVKG